MSQSCAATSEISEWVFESVLQFIESPLWTVPVDGFIDAHCGLFDTCAQENKLEYTNVHNEFRVIVDRVLSDFLSEIGVEAESFVEALKLRSNDQIGQAILEYIIALDDFRTFRALMEKRKLDLELEALMAQHETGSQHISESDELDDDDDYEKEEQFLVDMAIQASLSDVALKKMEKEDAEALQQLAMQIALEHERLVYAELHATSEAAREKLQRDYEEAVKRINEETQRERVRKMEESLAQQDLKLRTAPQQLGPISDRRRPDKCFSGAAPLPTPSVQHATCDPQQPNVGAQPTFEEVKASVVQQSSVPATCDAAAPSEAELAKRREYLSAQRDMIRQKKQAEREKQLADLQAQQCSSKTAPAVESKPSSVALSEEEKENQVQKGMRIALARRFKEDLILETRKAAAANNS